MNDLFTTLDSLSKNSDFAATLSQRGGYITFSNSGRRGGAKCFQIGLDSLLSTLQDILDNLPEFAGMTNYVEADWRDKGSQFFHDPVANANSSVQTKPLFSTLSKLIIWGNQPTYDHINSDQVIILKADALKNTIGKLEKIADSFKPSVSFSVPSSYSTKPSQIIYYGCPGTGKSYKVKKQTEGNDGELAVYFDDKGNKIPTPGTKEDRVGKPSNIFRTTFHPDYDYAAFVGSYKPVMKPVLNGDGTESGKEEISYDFVPQVFTNAYVRAYRSLADATLTEAEKQVYLIIEEINRGNCAQIFGDLFQLLDRKDGHSEYAIIPEAELGKYLKGLKYEGLNGDKLELPANLHIYATMNTSDQSLFPMDSAFKRRWEMEYIPINLDDKNSDAKDYTFTVKGVVYSWIEFLKKVNPLIRKATDSEDKQMGEFFIKGNSLTEVEFKNKVMFYLWNDVCKDLYSASRISADYFLRDGVSDDNKTVFTFAELYGDGRIDTENGGTVTSPTELLEGFITKKLGMKPKNTAPDSTSGDSSAE
jgi:hypothetical protein